MSSSPDSKNQQSPEEPPAGVAVFDEGGALSRDFLLQRGYCCDNSCRNCPYEKVDDEEMEASKQS